MNDRPSIALARSPRSRGEEVGSLADYPPALIEVMLERVIASNTFRRSQRHRHFLEHVIRAGLAGQRDRLKEVIIGIEVFGRTLPIYDPRRDPIVRVEAGRIRDKLARFYDNEGAGEAFQIVIPIGNYMPQFVRRRVVGDGARPAPNQALAVLPFSNLSGDNEAAAFAFGLADQLIDTIGRVPGLRVVARMSALKARDASMDLKAIGKLLGVEHVVEGSLQRSGPRTRCIAQISRAKDSVRVWSQRFEHDAESDSDLFTFQDAIADAVLAAVSDLMQPQALPRPEGVAHSWSGLRPSGTENHEARDLFERARYLSQQRTFEGYSRAVTLLERAIALDASFPQAYSLLGSAYANRTGFNLEPTFPTFAKVEWAARRALELDPLDGEARSLLATIAYRVEYRWAEADALFQEALRLAPNSTMVHSSYAWSLVFNGRSEDALRHAKLSQDLDPLNLGLRANNASIAMHALDFNAAIDAFNSILQIEPDHVFSRIVGGITLMAMGQPDDAITHFDHVIHLTNGHASARFSRLCAQGLRGDLDDARLGLDQLMAEIGDRHYSRMNLGMTQTCLGDIDGAMHSLTQAAETRDLLFPSALVHPLFAPVRVDSRFDALLARFGLAPPQPYDARSPMRL
jgi:TolB-like protein/Flp pilus assembly protein TadD